MQPEKDSVTTDSRNATNDDKPSESKSADLKELIPALIRAQGAFNRIVKDATNPFHRSKYATLDGVVEAICPALRENGLIFVQTTDGENLVTTLYHTSGQFLSSKYPLNVVKRDPQGYASAVTYARRYSMLSMVGAAPVGEDDDGNSHAEKKPVAIEEKKPVVQEPPKIKLEEKSIGEQTFIPVSVIAIKDAPICHKMDREKLYRIETKDKRVFYSTQKGDAEFVRDNRDGKLLCADGYEVKGIDGEQFVSAVRVKI